MTFWEKVYIASCDNDSDGDIVLFWRTKARTLVEWPVHGNLTQKCLVLV